MSSVSTCFPWGWNTFAWLSVTGLSGKRLFGMAWRTSTPMSRLCGRRGGFFSHIETLCQYQSTSISQVDSLNPVLSCQLYNNINMNNYSLYHFISISPVTNPFFSTSSMSCPSPDSEGFDKLTQNMVESPEKLVAGLDQPHSHRQRSDFTTGGSLLHRIHPPTPKWQGRFTGDTDDTPPLDDCFSLPLESAASNHGHGDKPIVTCLRWGSPSSSTKQPSGNQLN